MKKQSGTVAVVMLTSAAIVSLIMIAIGVVESQSEGGSDELANLGMLGLIIAASAGAVVLAILGQKPGSNKADTDRIVEQLRQLQLAMERSAQHAALSDDARRVLNRAKERELLCRAIEEDIRSQDWAAAQVLVTELAQRFGYERDAEQFRMRIEMARAEGLDQEVNEAIQQLDHLIVQRRWDDAVAAADRIAAGFPVSPRVHGLRGRVATAKRQYKEELERRFLLAAQAERVEEAMEILKDLDHYLTEREAEPFREVARGVIGKARENLGAAFKLACQDRQWGIAISLGEQISREFPNSRMAQEVQDMLPSLRQRAGEHVGS
ncbi:MAG: hypothetical protein KDA31_04675 [Phycisphaerales bacterium]|nr:hypothetical protein [Phycisphaerales bacterium]MCB9835685.1 hypothetical protein [Phycisphaera sp.]